MRARNAFLLPLLMVFLAIPATAQDIDPCHWPEPANPWNGIVTLPPECPAGWTGELTIAEEPTFYIVAKPGVVARDVNLVVHPDRVPNEREFFTGEIFIRVSGYGTLAGFERAITIPVTGEMRFAEQSPGDPAREIDATIHSLEGDLFGDPDFCTLRFRAGEAYGLPSPGVTKLTELPDGSFNVDSFFDVTYEIDFEGCPGSILEGLSDSTQSADHMQMGVPYEPPLDLRCLEPDNGTGTIDLPSVCPEGYIGELTIIDGLPPGTMISGPAALRDILVTSEGPGGILGGEFQQFDAAIYWEAIGEGDMAGFFRTLYIPVVCEFHTGPHIPGDPIQTFPNEIFRLQGMLFGDPDFCDLVITSGSDYAMPSPGSTTLTRLPSGDFAVDSFFDVTYRIDFQGCPGSILEGLAGQTLDTKRFQLGEPYVVGGIDDSVTPRLGVLHQNTPNPFNPTTVIRYELPPGGGHVKLDVFDVGGRHVRNLVDEVRSGGAGSVTWNGTDADGDRAPSGVYFYKLATEKETLVRKMAVLK